MSTITRAHSSTRTTRSWAGSPTAVATGSTAATRSSATQAGVPATTTSRSSSTTTPAWRTSPRCPTRVLERQPALLDAAVWFAGHGVRIERVLTDNAWAYTKATYRRRGRRDRRTPQADPAVSTADQRQGRAVHQDPARRVGLRQALPVNAERLERPSRWVDYYNTERTHTSLGGITPMAALVNNVRGNHS